MKEKLEKIMFSLENRAETLIFMSHHFDQNGCVNEVTSFASK